MKINNSKLYHSKKWRDFRKSFLRNNFSCFICNSTLNLEIDHVLEHDDDEQLFYNKTNLQTLCKQCHFTKTMLDKKIQNYFKVTDEFIIEINEAEGLLTMKELETFYTWNREKELTKKIIVDILSRQNPNNKIIKFCILDLDFWKIKKIIDGFCFHFQASPKIIFRDEELFIKDFLKKLIIIN